MTEEKDIRKMAEELGIKKENLELGLKKDKANVTESIKKAYDFMNTKAKVK